jgi:2'-5' RNA ligase
MTTSFFVEFRLRGFARQYAIWVEERIHREARRLHLKHERKRKLVSHITLFGPAKTKNARRVMSEVANIGKRYTFVPFQLNGFGKFLNNDANWFYIKVLPTIKLERLRHELAEALSRSDKTIANTCQNSDKGDKFRFHSSIGKFDPKQKAKFEQLYEYANSKCTIEDFKKNRASLFRKILNGLQAIFVGKTKGIDSINLHLLRITVLGKRSRIQGEYDLILKKMLSRREALSKYWSKRTLNKFRNLKAVL